MKALKLIITLVLGLIVIPEINNRIEFNNPTYYHLYNNFEFLQKNPHWINKIITYSSRNDLDPILLTALIYKESRGNPNATGEILVKTKCGWQRARGLGQLLPCYHAVKGVSIYDVDFNIGRSAEYLAWCIRRGKGNLRKGLKNYNSGPYSTYYNEEYIAEIITTTTIIKDYIKDEDTTYRRYPRIKNLERLAFNGGR